MNIGIIGSRSFNDYDYFKEIIDFIVCACGVDNIISGGAKGADSFAERYAEECKIKIIVHKPDWNKYGKKAGYLRNIEIVNDSDIVVAFWDGKSKGTQHTINLCKKNNKRHYIFWRNK